MKFIIFTLFVALAALMSVSMVEADCLSGLYKGPCAAWDDDNCKLACRNEGRRSGHCAASLKCWCEGC
ncbi:drosomycin-like [Drosophila busckii]|uniref:drosomycin-like n=1 Tax=Drosophila busckii TaxID=30019 RepID=UPI00083F4735|nr:drosomycin-like [Drosophila busckii]